LTQKKLDNNIWQNNLIKKLLEIWHLDKTFTIQNFIHSFYSSIYIWLVWAHFLCTFFNILFKFTFSFPLIHLPFLSVFVREYKIRNMHIVHPSRSAQIDTGENLLRRIAVFQEICPFQVTVAELNRCFSKFDQNFYFPKILMVW